MSMKFFSGEGLYLYHNFSLGGGTTIELEYPERLCYYVHGVRIENTPLPCLPAQANRAGRKTNAAPKFSYESSVSPISMDEVRQGQYRLRRG